MKYYFVFAFLLITKIAGAQTEDTRTSNKVGLTVFQVKHFPALSIVDSYPFTPVIFTGFYYQQSFRLLSLRATFNRYDFSKDMNYSRFIDEGYYWGRGYLLGYEGSIALLKPFRYKKLFFQTGINFTHSQSRFRGTFDGYLNDGYSANEYIKVLSASAIGGIGYRPHHLISFYAESSFDGGIFYRNHENSGDKGPVRYFAWTPLNVLSMEVNF